jgi:signal peptidase I
MLFLIHIITNKFIYKFKNPVRGDIIVFLYPEDPRKVFIKRVIATEGEEIRIKDKQVFINGKAIDDPWGVYGERRGLFIPGPLRPRDNYGPKVVPPNSLFVLGDNRDNSQDSRYWGFVDLSAVKGKALYIYWAKNSSRIGTDIK